MKIGASYLATGLAIVIIASIMFCGCGKSKFEQGSELFGKEMYEQALPLLEEAVQNGDNAAKAREMIKSAKAKMEVLADQDCIRHADDYIAMLAQSKTVVTWDKLIQELKSYRCRQLDNKPYVNKAYVAFVTHLAKWDAYPQAVSKYCEFTGCTANEPHVLIREEEITIIDEEGKPQKETIQQEIPVAHHEIVMQMFDWMVKKDPANARWFDRYAKFLYDTERFKNANDAYQAIANFENIGYEVKSRAKLTVDHLSKGKVKRAGPDDSFRFFWIEDVKIKSKVKALVKDLEKAKMAKEKLEAELEAAKTENTTKK